MNWKQKAKLFRALSFLPFGAQLHYQLQRRVTKEWPRRVEALDELLVAAKRVFQASEGRHDHFLEIGAGRDFAVAVALRCLGVRSITCVDVSRLARPALVRYAAKHMANRLGVTVPKIDDWSDIEAFGIKYVSPKTLQTAGLADSSFDCFYSIDTLEHIPPGDIRDVFSCARKLVRPDGLLIHCIDYSDHFARGDNDLSRFNFLTYSEKEWQPYNSKFQFVNRLRHSDYLEIFRDVGANVILDEPDIEAPQQDIIDRLDQKFSGYDVVDLFTIRALIVAENSGDVPSENN